MALCPDPPAVVMLRAQYRCAMCHKHCAVPCQLTRAEFAILEQTAIDEQPIEEAASEPPV